MKIIKSTESIQVSHPVFCIFGQPGIGKSSLGYSAKDPLLLDFDAGAHRAANRRDTAQIETWSDVEDLKEALAPYSTVIVDTVGRCLDLMAADIIDKNPKYGRDGSLTLQGYGVLKSRFRTWVTTLRAMGKDPVFIAHHKEDKDGDTRVVRPDITGSSYDEVMKISDFVGYLYMNGRDRVLEFNPTDRWVGKNPGSWKQLKVPPVDKAQAFLAELIDKGRAALGGISEESSKVASQVDDWRAAIQTYATADDCNKGLAELKKVTSALVGSQAKKMLETRATELNLEYSKETKGFIEKVAVPA